MMHDLFTMHAKGRVKIELYDGDEIVSTIEKHNLVVNDANSIVGLIMADPASVIEASHQETLNTGTDANSAGYYDVILSKTKYTNRSYITDVGPLNTQTSLVIPGSNEISKIYSVKVNNVELIQNNQFDIDHAKLRQIGFLVAPVNTVEIQYQEVKSKIYNMLKSSEIVTVNGIRFEKAAEPDDATKKYKIDYETGAISFETAKTNVTVTYRYELPYGINFMTVGNKPSASHPSGSPVEFANHDKLKTFMAGEYENARVEIQHPRSVTFATPELQILQRKTSVGGTDAHLFYSLNDGPILKLLSVTYKDDLGNPTTASLTEYGLMPGNGDVWIENPYTGLLKLNPVFYATLTNQATSFTIQYQVNAGTTVTYVADFPKGTPSAVPVVEDYQVLPLSAGILTYSLNKPIAQNALGQYMIEIKKNGNALAYGADFTINSADPKQITFTSAADVTTSDNVTYQYTWNNDTLDIYQVAMFTHQDKTNTSPEAKMFNISGIGPVIKDRNTGMRISWSVTF